jgi:hypothetical protein
LLYSKVVCGGQHGGAPGFQGPAGQTKSRQVWRLFGLLAAILQIARDPPTASELS